MSYERIIVTSISLSIVVILTIFMYSIGHHEIFGMVVVGMLWGCTNVFMKQGIHFHHNENDTFFQNIITDIKTLVTSYSFVVPFLINQTGSILFTILLGNNDFSLVVPISNALTFIFTFITAYLLGENQLSLKCITGVLLVLLGVTICQTAK
ncbi:hypothetical protein EHI8A_132890 [Entamoeba histolytica HM-1:IMSS-B]|uniref:Transmembrane protein n=6 Tax=Entamoeba histolytica TaxID=5759 RepID=C4M4F8_ENTH1|nr:hypothetical protein, conserved [Entamoeba histolytica HM-1:IMSS]EMD43469.1 membrane protein [Entamoeba histolytica KU27]EMH75170.1 hypothetical protein EHI8A_132890 [Entamoeba histolytica HM-1:IMSS-B]ENY61759.1 membrane protein, putative [Entamoeba histolytica HM-1:IMSS-A]GAT96257.1 hypothetical protein conserved [Entamoeba histolytica]EAL51143.2 hypothetical protein, conserved [Entamoeba histolytica HM-1:IMSS]|eukprot:XP_656529.2 hypothetical protein, conserved [Entamoeba histolytica HM-1:IMSS]